MAKAKANAKNQKKTEQKQNQQKITIKKLKQQQ